MKTKELIQRLFESNDLRGAQRRAALEKLIEKLERKEKKLRRKLDGEQSTKAERKTRAKLNVNALHQKKASELMEDLSEVGQYRLD